MVAPDAIAAAAADVVDVVVAGHASVTGHVVGRAATITKLGRSQYSGDEQSIR